MSLKAPIVIFGTVIASAVTALPALAPVSATSQQREVVSQTAAELVAVKVDRLRLLDPACTGDTPSATCADIYGKAEGPPPTVTVGRKIDESTSVLLRLPVSQIARSRPLAIAEN